MAHDLEDQPREIADGGWLMACHCEDTRVAERIIEDVTWLNGKGFVLRRAVVYPEFMTAVEEEGKGFRWLHFV